jgi:PTS system nitrogen regulatory IIA component
MNKLLNALKTECVDAGHSASSKDAVLSRIAELAAACPALDNISQDHILQGMQERESLGSTGFGGGIAIPHCRLPDVKDFVVGLVSVPAGVAFDAMDEQPVRLFVFIVAPDNRSNDHIHLLSAISQALNIPGAVDEMLKSPTSESLRESFLRHVQDEATGDEEEDERSLFHIVIQNEDFFRDVLQVFGSMESSSAIVLDRQSKRFQPHDCRHGASAPRKRDHSPYRANHRPLKGGPRRDGDGPGPVLRCRGPRSLARSSNQPVL